MRWEGRIPPNNRGIWKEVKIFAQKILQSTAVSVLISSFIAQKVIEQKFHHTNMFMHMNMWKVKKKDKENIQVILIKRIVPLSTQHSTNVD